MDARCLACTAWEMQAGVCLVLAENAADAGLGAVTGYIMYISFAALPVWFVLCRRVSWLWVSIAMGLANAVGAICHAAVKNNSAKRPRGACSTNGVSCGMPSGHVIVEYTILTFLLLKLARDVKVLGWSELFEEVKTVTGFLKFVVWGSYCMILFLCPFGRMAIHYHTPAQVGYGCLTGILLAAFLFIVFTLINPYVAPVLGRSCFGRSWIRDDFSWNPVFVQDATDRKAIPPPRPAGQVPIADKAEQLALTLV